ncbi:hypothetical protein G7Y89_g12719 [Cudoniella acicularis]|uniref:Ketosynthase family 3 (KS3) domain-containing protein n=1 Tax=Cudoniella acicularis TaxID=354080 RepID=A0A8H4RAW5_9HELO|nr:hypothetical protein G7Y89_g12719 [Cudoniella acicularis]
MNKVQEPIRRLVVRPINTIHKSVFYHPTAQHHGHSNVRHAYVLAADPGAFDAQFFGIKPVEAKALDPQQRLLLETVYEGLESAGLPVESLRGSDTSVYVGLMCHDYEAMLLRDLQAMPTYHTLGTQGSIIANRISYFFDWHGPSMTLDRLQLGPSTDTYARVGLDAKKGRDRCQHFEAHGTGTPAGDPIEAEAIHGVFFGGGAGAENIVGARVVTAGGRIVDTDNDEELFWGLRGAGNNQLWSCGGVSCKAPCPLAVLGGWVGFPSSEAEEVLGGFEKMCDENMPAEFNGDIIFSRVPDAGGSVVMFIKPHGFLTLLNATFKNFKGDLFYVTNPTMARYTRAFGRIIANNPIPKIGHVVGGTHNIHGAIETPNQSVALPNRRHITLTLFGAISSEFDADGPELQIVKDWANKFAGEVESEGLATRDGYVSFSCSNIDLDNFYGKGDAARLKALKRRYNPENFFFLAYPTLV